MFYVNLVFRYTPSRIIGTMAEAFFKEELELTCSEIKDFQEGLNNYDLQCLKTQPRPKRVNLVVVTDTEPRDTGSDGGIIMNIAEIQIFEKPNLGK